MIEDLLEVDICDVLHQSFIVRCFQDIHASVICVGCILGELLLDHILFSQGVKPGHKLPVSDKLLVVLLCVLFELLSCFIADFAKLDFSLLLFRNLRDNLEAPIFKCLL